MHLLPFLSQKRLYNHKCLSVRPSVCPSVCHRIPSASQNQAYLPLLLCINLSDTYQQSCHAAIIPISHSPPPSYIMPISNYSYQPQWPISHHAPLALWPLYLSANWPAFATSKPFRLVSNHKMNLLFKWKLSLSLKLKRKNVPNLVFMASACLILISL